MKRYRVGNQVFNTYERAIVVAMQSIQPIEEEEAGPTTKLYRVGGKYAYRTLDEAIKAAEHIFLTNGVVVSIEKETYTPIKVSK